MEKNYCVSDFYSILREKIIDARKSNGAIYSAVLSLPVNEYFDFDTTTRELAAAALRDYFNDLMPLREKLALLNYIGYFDNGMNENIYIALHISKIDTFTRYIYRSYTADIFENNHIETHCNGGGAEYFIYDQDQNIFAFYDHKSLWDHVDNIMPHAIKCMFEKCDPDDDMTIEEYFENAINEALSDPIMQW